MPEVIYAIVAAVVAGVILFMLGWLLKQNATKSDVKQVQDDLDAHKRDDEGALTQVNERLRKGDERMKRIEDDVRGNREASIRVETKIDMMSQRIEDKLDAHDKTNDSVLQLAKKIYANGNGQRHGDGE